MKPALVPLAIIVQLAHHLPRKRIALLVRIALQAARRTRRALLVITVQPLVWSMYLDHAVLVTIALHPRSVVLRRNVLLVIIALLSVQLSHHASPVSIAARLV
jgi:hypothetical protein